MTPFKIRLEIRLTIIKRILLNEIKNSCGGVTGLLAANVAHAAEVYNKDGINSTFMARLPLYVILLMISGRW